MRENIRIMKQIVGGESQEIAYYRGCSRQRVEREYNPNFPNLLDRIEQDILAWGQVNWSKVRIFENWLKLLIRHLHRQIVGVKGSFEPHHERQLIQIKNLFDELVAV